MHVKHPDAQLSPDDLLAALSDAQRRKLLDSLVADSPPDGAGRSGIVVEPDIAMRHTHLPKLADYGLIEWDEETDRVTKGPRFESANEILEALPAHDGLRAPGAEEL